MSHQHRSWHFTAPDFEWDTVRVLDLVRGNLSDRGCRHLMLLTQNAAALQLLFDGGLLHEQVVCCISGHVANTSTRSR